ncbi:DUF6382 domain-containing protein [Paenibacillus sp. P26]|nr:DUF6382 domain-containing protein [Paenibacillus sp. P26]
MTGKRMLTHRLRTEKLTLQRFYSLLLEIADVLDDSKIYMLQAGRYILKEDFIFCGNGLEDLHFTYVPKEQLDSKASVAADLQRLASAWIHRVEELQGKGFQELMSYLQEENFNLPELKQHAPEASSPPGRRESAGGGETAWSGGSGVLQAGRTGSKPGSCFGRAPGIGGARQEA